MSRRSSAGVAVRPALAALLVLGAGAAVCGCTSYHHSSSAPPLPERTDGRTDRLALTLQAARYLAPGGVLLLGSATKPLREYGPLLRLRDGGLEADEAEQKLRDALLATGWFGEFTDHPSPDDVRCTITLHEVDTSSLSFWGVLSALTLAVLPSFQDLELLIDVELRARGQFRSFRRREVVTTASGWIPMLILRPLGSSAGGQFEEIAATLAASVVQELQEMSP